MASKRSSAKDEGKASWASSSEKRQGIQCEACYDMERFAADADLRVSSRAAVLGINKPVGALIVLNGEPLQKQVLDLVWPLNDAQLDCPRICADGAANLLQNFSAKVTCSAKSPQIRRIPTHIVGDLDSLTKEAQAHFSELGTRIVEMNSENSNDFHKALKIAKQSTRVTEENLPIVVIGGMAGRMDQTLANINQLYCCAEQGLQVFWLSKQNMLVMYAPGTHKISVKTGSKCGLIPIGGPVQSITTTGLRWNMTKQKMAFGTHNLVSSSNETVADEVGVQVSDPVLWTVELNIE